MLQLRYLYFIIQMELAVVHTGNTHSRKELVWWMDSAKSYINVTEFHVQVEETCFF